MKTSTRALAFIMVLASSPQAEGQRRADVSEPLLPSDSKECVQMAGEYQSRVDEAMSERNACTSRLIELATRHQAVPPRSNQTNKACLAQLPESQREVLAFTCNEDSRCAGQGNDFYVLLERKREATASCYARVNVYHAVEKALKELRDRVANDKIAGLEKAKELERLANFARSRDLELNQQMEARAAAVFLENQRLAREFHREAMKEFYNHQNWLRGQYETAMNQVFNSYLANQQFAWRMAEANARNDSGTRMALLRGQYDAFSSAYASVGECTTRNVQGRGLGMIVEDTRAMVEAIRNCR